MPSVRPLGRTIPAKSIMETGALTIRPLRLYT
jgi:hypothetical protein